MSFTFTLSGNSSVLSSQFFPPISLKGEWEIGLLNLETFNSIPNLYQCIVTVGKVKNKRRPDTPREWEVTNIVTIPTGSYELEDIANFVNKKVGSSIISFHGNRNTLKTEVRVEGAERFVSVNPELGELLGVGGTYTFTSDTPEVLGKTNISKINVIRVNCDIAQSSYLNGKPTHSIYEFYPNVPPGFRVIEVPNTVVYYSINTNTISRIQIELKDQDDKQVDFRGETITARLHIRERK